MNCHSSKRTSAGPKVFQTDPGNAEHALEHQEARGADEAGDALAELAEGVGVVVHAEPAALARAS